ncbi:hypothetical protein FNF31_07151 [Cafeteria roenbergensis]|uniref:Uncharacterized protein n=1 Tax=Cafeteria roenbergensis TaxID=33653 RepID=A0A5A8C9V5_CAFRO|nr:hypothetical protein FNF31_07151 [Cafeteria roenbergensis]
MAGNPSKSRPIPIGRGARSGIPIAGAGRPVRPEAHGSAISASLPPPKPLMGSLPPPRLTMPMPELELPPTDPGSESIMAMRGSGKGVAMSAPAANFMHLARTRAAEPAPAASKAPETGAGGAGAGAAGEGAMRASVASSIGKSPTILAVLRERPGDLGAFRGKRGGPAAAQAGAAGGTADKAAAASGLSGVLGNTAVSAPSGAPAAGTDPADMGGHPWEEEDDDDGLEEGEEEDEEEEEEDDDEDAVGGGVFEMS